jgi:hypothetical protein
MSFGVFMPVGPGNQEVLRAADTLESLAAHSKALRWAVLVDDAIDDRHLSDICRLPISCSVTVLHNPREGRGLPQFGGICVSLLSALDLLQRTEAEFALKLDADSLVIGSFEQRVEQVLQERPDAGLLGVIGDSFGENRTYTLEASNRFWMERVLAMPPTYDNFKQNGPPGWLGTPDETWYQCFLQARRVLVQAVERGYNLGSFCWGGCMVMSRPLLDALRASEAFRETLVWRDLALGDDMMISIYCQALGLKMYDVSQTGPQFAVQWGTLPLSCEELSRSKYSVIHSVKGCQEDAFRAYFRKQRCFTTEKPDIRGHALESASLEDRPETVLCHQTCGGLES